MSGAAAAAAITTAVRSWGVIVSIDPHELEDLVRRNPSALVVHQPPAGLFQRKHRYLTYYRGFTFHADSAEELLFPRATEVVSCAKVWLPG
jgi:hypothetical protein